jgi:hypothetical protein
MLACVEGRCRNPVTSAPDASNPDASAPNAGGPSAGAAAMDSGTAGGPTEAGMKVAFKAGYYDAEQIWLRMSDGELRQVSDWPVDPRRAETCSSGKFPGGRYPEGAGRFSTVVFDSSGRYLLMAETRDCSLDPVTRLQVYDSVTRERNELYGMPRDLISGGGVTAVTMASDLGRVDQLYEFRDGTLVPIEIPSRGSGAGRILFEPRALRFAGASLLFLRALVLEKRDDAWTRFTGLDGLGDDDVAYVAPSRSGTCCAASRSATSTRMPRWGSSCARTERSAYSTSAWTRSTI